MKPRAIMSKIACSFIVLLAQSGPINAEQLSNYEGQKYPTLTVHGFGEARYYNETLSGKKDVVAGQQAFHVISSFSERITAFGEFSLTFKESDTDTDVERLFIRYDFSDRLKLSLGRYHTPVGFWNASYHHGAWLQTTIDRPRVMKFGSQILPIHFEGVLAEGNLPVANINLAYRAGVGTGIHNNITVNNNHGHHGETDGDNAFTLQLYNRPSNIHGLEFGASYYRDKVNIDSTPHHEDEHEHSAPDINEEIFGVHIALEQEAVEFIAEYIYWEHKNDGGAPLSNTGNGFYVQAAHRLSGRFHQLKPYIRLDKISADNDDILFAKDQSFEGATLGLRYDFTDSAALKVEYRNQQEGDDDRFNSLVMQLSIVLPNMISL
ncbi:MAG: hypothetical protein AB9Q22_00435 [Candidatus Reddybacter sp.]